MKNYEKYKSWFDEHDLELKYCQASFGVNKETHGPFICTNSKCSMCEFFKSTNCARSRIQWLKEEAIEVDWNKVERDTLIEIENMGGEWRKRYFDSFKNGKVRFYKEGATSKTMMGTMEIEAKHARVCDEPSN